MAGLKKHLKEPLTKGIRLAERRFVIIYEITNEFRSLNDRQERYGRRYLPSICTLGNSSPERQYRALFQLSFNVEIVPSIQVADVSIMMGLMTLSLFSYCTVQYTFYRVPLSRQFLLCIAILYILLGGAAARG
jgi:hypothetical protein